MRKRVPKMIIDAFAWVITLVLFAVGGLVLVVNYPWLILLVPILIPLLILGMILRVLDGRKTKGKSRRAARSVRPRKAAKPRTIKKVIEKKTTQTIIVQQVLQTAPPTSPEPLPENVARHRAPLYGGFPYCRQCGERLIMESESPTGKAAIFRCRYCKHKEIIPAGGLRHRSDKLLSVSRSADMSGFAYEPKKGIER